MEEPPKHPGVAAMFSELLTKTGLNAAGLAKKLGITPQAVSNYIVGRNEPGRKMIAAIIKAFPAVNAVWLATGEGEPFPNGVHGRAYMPGASDAPAEPESDVQAPATVKRKMHTPMAVVRAVDGMTPEQQIAYYKLRWETAEQKLLAMEEAQAHEETVRLLSAVGGVSFSDASAEAADDDYTPPVMVAETNPDYVEAAPEADRLRISGFVIGRR
jgi:hypothetical protein